MKKLIKGKKLSQETRTVEEVEELTEEDMHNWQQAVADVKTSVTHTPTHIEIDDFDDLPPPQNASQNAPQNAPQYTPEYNAAQLKGLNPEESTFFEDYINGKTTLEEAIPGVTPEPSPLFNSSYLPEAREDVKPFVEGTQARELPEQGTQVQGVQVVENTSACIAGWLPSLDTKTRKNLKEGRIKLTKRIDLHGYYLLEAYEILRNFLAYCQGQGHKAVLIIHGKGEGTQAGIGEIKKNLAHFLADQPAVLAFHTAVPKHGGSGACYVLLRRAKN